MKTRSFLTPLFAAATLLCAVSYQPIALAQGGGGGGQPLLTQEQRTKMRDSMEASQSDLTALNEKLVAAQKDAVKAALAKDSDEKTVRAKVEAVAKIQTDIAMLRLKGVKEIAPTLTDEQKTRLNDRPGMGYNALFGGFGGGGGRRGGGGGGNRNQ